MTRLFFSVLGAVLLACWAIGLATHGSSWMVWVDFIAGSFSFVVAMSPVFTGDHHHSDVAPYAFGLTTVLVLAFVGDLFLRAPIWLSVMTLLLAVAYLGVALLYQRNTRLGYR
jgi:hypothetical protein